MTIMKMSGMGLLAALLAGQAPAFSADVNSDLRIDRVTVYKEGATVTRSGQVAIPAGSHRLVIKGLPEDVDPRTLRLTLEGGPVQLGSVELSEVKDDHAGSQELKRKIETLEDERSVVQDEITTAEMQLKLVSALATNPSGTIPKTPIDATNLSAALATMGASDSAARKRIHESRLKIRRMDLELEKLKAEQTKESKEEVKHTDVHASIESAGATTVRASLSYGVSDAGWEWIYQARLDSEQKKIAFDRQGAVHQASGENWKDVILVLTTARPSTDVATPKISSAYLSLESELARKVNSPSAPAAGAGELEEVVVTGARRAEASGTEYAADYKVPARVSLSSDGDPQLYPIEQEEFDVQLVARIVPSVNHAAYLESVFQFQSERPIAAGHLALYRDNAYVGEMESPTFLPGTEVRIPFGTDERIRVVVREEPGQSGQRGVISKQTVKETRRRVDVTSFHTTPMPVEILDRIPVSKTSDIRVEVLKGATEPTTKDFEGKPGVLLWKFVAQPQKLTSIHHYYSTQYPANRQLEQSESNDTDD